MAGVCAIVPMFNEEAFAYETLSALKNIKIIDNIVAVDDGSSDRTWDIISSMDDIIPIRHDRNMGKAESIRDGIRHCNADIYLFADGDLGRCSQKLKALIQEVLDDKCDMCVAKFPEVKGYGGMGLVKGLSRFAVKKITGTDFPCPLSGQRALKKELLMDKRVGLYSRFGIDVGMLIDALNSGYRVKIIELDLKHDYTKNNAAGYIHRFRQFCDITAVFLKCLLRW